LDEWKTNISKFFVLHGARFDLISHPLARAYNLLSEIERSSVVNRVRRRVLLVFFYRLKVGSNLKRLKPGSPVLQYLAQTITCSGLVGDDVGIVEGRLADWATRGERYELLAEGLKGCGSLLVLPEDIGDSM
jgi:hypothetical protein